jgi:hypothetical protein
MLAHPTEEFQNELLQYEAAYVLLSIFNIDPFHLIKLICPNEKL